MEITPCDGGDDAEHNVDDFVVGMRSFEEVYPYNHTNT